MNPARTSQLFRLQFDALEIDELTCFISHQSAMRAFSIVPIVVSISILAGLCLSHIFSVSHANALQTSSLLQPASGLFQRQLSSAFDSKMRFLDARFHAHLGDVDRNVQLTQGSPLFSHRAKVARTAAAAAVPAASSNPLINLQDEIKSLEAKDGTLQKAIARATQVAEETKRKAANAAARPSSVSAKASASSYSPSQIAADLAKTKESTAAASSAVVVAQQKVKELVKEEYNLRKEIDDLLAKLEGVRIVTGAHVYVADGMGGSVFEAEVSRPIGGKSSVKVIKGVNAAVEAVEKKVAAAEAAKDVKAAPSFPQKDKGNDGLGGANPVASLKEPTNVESAVVAPKGLTSPVSGDDGMGERVVPAAKVPFNAEASSGSPKGLSSATRDGGMGEIPGKAVNSNSLVPSNAEPQPFIMSHGKNVDGIGGTGRRLLPRISNGVEAKLPIMARFKKDGLGVSVEYLRSVVPNPVIVSAAPDKGDGMGGPAHDAQLVRVAVPETPLTGPMVATKTTNDGMGGKKTGRK